MAKPSDDLSYLMKQTASAVPMENKLENANYIVHTLKLQSLASIDRGSAEAVRDRTVDYLTLCAQDGIKPNLTGYALALGTNRAGLRAMFTDRRVDKAAYAELDRGMTMIENIMLELMMDQKINVVSAIFLLKNHFDYKDQSDVNVRAERVETIDNNDLEAKYASVIDADYEDIDDSPAADEQATEVADNGSEN